MIIVCIFLYIVVSCVVFNAFKDDIDDDVIAAFVSGLWPATIPVGILARFISLVNKGIEKLFKEIKDPRSNV